MGLELTLTFSFYKKEDNNYTLNLGYTITGDSSAGFHKHKTELLKALSNKNNIDSLHLEDLEDYKKFFVSQGFIENKIVATTQTYHVWHKNFTDYDQILSLTKAAENYMPKRRIKRFKDLYNE
jgi:hypothetical protein